MAAINTIAFDADDTLWVNEVYFRQTEAELAQLLKEFTTPERLAEEITASEMSTLPFYGYGIKWFTLSLIDAALRITENRVPQEIIARILERGRQQAEMPIVLLDGVHEVLREFKGRYRLVMATKGDLAEQRRKIGESGIDHYFDHIEVMRDKKPDNYRELLARLSCAPKEFLMVGNSLRSDILPVLELGGHAVHIPNETIWAHEHVDTKPDHPLFRELGNLSLLPRCDFLCNDRTSGE